MKKFSEVDGGNPDGTAKDRVGVNPGTKYLAAYYNDNIFNLFEFVQTQGYTLIADDLSQIAKASKALYNPDYTYNTSAIATQSVNDVVRGSDGNYYEAQADGISGDDPVGSVTGDWKRVPFDLSGSDPKLFSTAGGTANSIALTIPSITDYETNSIFMFKATATNTGATTVNLNGLGIKNIVIDTVPLVGGEIVSGKEYFLRYTGTSFELIDFNSKSQTLPSITGTATFTNSTQNINLTGVGELDGLEIGDVIQITGAVNSKNNSEFTVEFITDSNNIVVNYEHRGQATSKALTDETSTSGVTIKLLAKWYNAPIGLGQDWVDVTARRALATVYTNNTNRTIFVSASSTVDETSQLSFYSNGNLILEDRVSSIGGSSGSSGGITISKDSTYEIKDRTSVYSTSLQILSELR